MHRLCTAINRLYTLIGVDKNVYIIFDVKVGKSVILW